ncbi:MAG: metallophosphatase domain-containing protein [Bacteroidota bacterium]
MTIAIISDTHGLEEELTLPQADVIIHAGDITDRGEKKEVLKFLDWYADLDYDRKVFIGGNHDLYLEENPVDLLELLPSNMNYLCNSSVTIDGIKIWGSPVTPDMVGWAYGRERKEMKAHWQYMPSNIDILLTHTPPFGILDKSSGHKQLGCQALLEKVQKRQPKYHIFGHIHASYGMKTVGETTYINASNLDSYRGLVNPPVVIDI